MNIVVLYMKFALFIWNNRLLCDMNDGANNYNRATAVTKKHINQSNNTINTYTT